MAWYDNAVFYHIYPLGLTGAPKQNAYAEPIHRMNELLPWIEHIRKLGCNALYIGPLFESVGHGYETTNYLISLTLQAFSRLYRHMLLHLLDNHWLLL